MSLRSARRFFGPLLSRGLLVGICQLGTVTLFAQYVAVGPPVPVNVGNLSNPATGAIPPLAPAPAQNSLRYIGIGSACFDLGKYEEAALWKRKAMLEEPGTAWVNRTLAVTYARLGDRSAARRSLDEFRRCCPDVTIRQVINAAPFKPDFWNRVAEGLDDLGLPL